MIQKCCVKNCNGNYQPENKVEMLKPAWNPEERKRLINMIPQGEHSRL